MTAKAGAIVVEVRVANMADAMRLSAIVVELRQLGVDHPWLDIATLADTLESITERMQICRC